MSTKKNDNAVVTRLNHSGTIVKTKLEVLGLMVLLSALACAGVTLVHFVKSDQITPADHLHEGFDDAPPITIRKRNENRAFASDTKIQKQHESPPKIDAGDDTQQIQIPPMERSLALVHGKQKYTSEASRNSNIRQC
jgi:hypothetical protein